MSKKRTSAASNNDEESNEASDLFQQDGNAKSANVTPLSDATLQGLPIEVLERILLKAVLDEVNSMKLPKSGWKQTADLVIGRYGTVCSRWNSILTTNFFRNEVHRILDETAQTIRLEVLHQSQIPLFVCKVATMKDEMFMLCRPESLACFINVHKRNNMMHLRDVIPLPRRLPEDMAACSVSNCVYLVNKESRCFSVLRIARNDQNRFHISPWITDLSLSFLAVRLLVSVNGSLIILSKQTRPDPSVLSIYNANGSLQHAITLFPAIHGFRFISSVIQKSNGNFVLATRSDRLDTELKEIDTNGLIVRQYRSPIYGNGVVNFADAFGGIMIAGLGNRSQLLDSEFNLLDLHVGLPQKHEIRLHIPSGLHYNSERDEIACLYKTGKPKNRTQVLTIFRFTGE